MKPTFTLNFQGETVFEMPEAGKLLAIYASNIDTTPMGINVMFSAADAYSIAGIGGGAVYLGTKFACQLPSNTSIALDYAGELVQKGQIVRVNMLSGLANLSMLFERP